LSAFENVDVLAVGHNSLRVLDLIELTGQNMML